ncbi:hypothetical protein [Bacillus sp. FJAT-45350]|uniref:hypothetical protein n=1 Tax=Bacillus sp. FJAT-45350 TaxID=2011014 RepID=UPI000BB77AEA|nr:hypothetical protein [Bacillus sp. FJAT-45350]
MIKSVLKFCIPWALGVIVVGLFVVLIQGEKVNWEHIFMVGLVGIICIIIGTGLSNLGKKNN